MSEIAQATILERSAVTLLGRVLDQDGLPVNPQDVTSVTWRVYDTSTSTWTAGVSVPAGDVLSDTLRTNDPRWTEDAVGFNLALALSGDNFPHTGDFKVEVTIVPAVGYPYVVLWDLQAEGAEGGLDLTSVDYVKTALQIKDNSLDDYLTQAITDVSRMIQDYLGGRQLAAQDHVEQHEGGDYGYLRVNHPPINSLASVTLDVGTPSPRTLDADQFRYNSTTGEIRLGAGSLYGGNLAACGTSASVSYNGGYSPVPGGVQRAVALIIGRLLRTYSTTGANVSSKSAGDVSVSYFNPATVDLADPIFGDAAHLLRSFRASMRY